MAELTDVGANAFISSDKLDKIFGPNPPTTRGQGLHFNVHPTLPLLIYASGKQIIVKNFLNPSEGFVYRGHSVQTTVAKFSPNGFWVASADIGGKVRVWSWDNPEHLTKLVTTVFNGQVFDLDWNHESNRLVAVGEGSEFQMKVFVFDTGNSVGELVGHAKRVISVAYKPSRPFRIMTGSEDMRTIFFTGPPFKLDHSNPTHTNFVNCVRYSPNGSFVVSVGSDRKLQKYDGATGQPVGEVVNAHEGGIYSVSFSPDSAKFATASADKTVKIWNSQTLELENTIQISANPVIADAQVSILWTKHGLLSLSLNGDFNFLNPTTQSPERTLQANQSSITAMYVDRENQIVYSGSADGVVIARKLNGDYSSVKIAGQERSNIYQAAHIGKVTGIAKVGDSLQTVGWDDKLRGASIVSNAYHSSETLNGQPNFIAQSNISDLVVVLTTKNISFYRGNVLVHSVDNANLSYNPVTAAIYNDVELAIGGSDFKTHIYNIENFAFSEVTSIETRSEVTCLAYHPAGDVLAIGDAGRQVEVYERGSWDAKVRGKWVFHTTRVTCLSWSPNGNYLASGGLDDNIFVWNLTNVSNKMQIQFAHSGGLSNIDWLNDERLISAGFDGIITTWKVSPF